MNMCNEIVDDEVLIIMPTVNHSKIVEEWFRIYEENSKKHRFKVLVIDSSDDDKTKRICENRSNYVKWIQFNSYNEKNTLKEMDDKVVEGFVIATTKYVWLTSDARVPNIDYCYDVVKTQIDESVDLIHFFCLKSKMNADYVMRHSERKKVNILIRKKSSDYDKNDLNDLFVDFFWSISTYGISITKRELIKKCDVDYIRNRYSGLSFLYPAMILECLTNSEKVKCRVINHGCFVANKLRKTNTWKVSGNAIKVYSEHVVKIIEALPDKYKQNKEQVISEFAINNCHMTYDDIIEWRNDGYYNLKEFLKYQQYIGRVAEKNKIVMLWLAIRPIKR